MAIENQSGTHFGATLVRIWFLIYLGLMGFVSLFMLVAGGMRGAPAAMSLVLVYPCVHILAFLGVVRRAYWAWTSALLVICLDLILHGALAVAVGRLRVHADLAQAIVLLTCPVLSLILLATPSVKPLLGSRARTV